MVFIVLFLFLSSPSPSPFAPFLPNSQQRHRSETRLDVLASRAQKNENEMKLATYKILQDIGISPQCKQKSISSIHTLSSITDHVTKEEGRTASGLTPKGIAAYYSDYIYSDVVCKKESMKEIDQIKLMETLFFGSGGPDAISYIDMFLSGGGVFEFMFEQHKRATLTIVPFLQLVQHRIKRMMKTTIK